MTSSTHITCTCREIIMKSDGDTGAIKIRSKILIIKGNTSFAICKNCGEEVEVPLLLRKSDEKVSINNPPLIITR